MLVPQKRSRAFRGMVKIVLDKHCTHSMDDHWICAEFAQVLLDHDDVHLVDLC